MLEGSTSHSRENEGVHVTSVMQGIMCVGAVVDALCSMGEGEPVLFFGLCVL